MFLDKINDGHREFKWSPVSATILNQSNDDVLIEFNNQINIMDGAKTNTNYPNIVLRRPLNYEIEKGWSWHKSWNLPEIVYSLNINKQYSSIDNAFSVEIFAVKKINEKQKYRNLGINGMTKKIMVQDQVEFKCLKFTTTSYNNNHQNIFLLIVLYKTTAENNSRVINAMISSEIFVDSRKFARFQGICLNETHSTEPFHPEQLKQELIKREIKNKKNSALPINGSIEGLINYYTASNIKNKIKHPIFLALKFSQSVKLFVDQKLAQHPNLALAIQQNLINCSHSKKHQKMVKLLISVSKNEQNLQKKAIEIIHQLENLTYEIYTQECYLPNGVIALTDLQLLQTQYESEFEKIRSLGVNIENEENDIQYKKVCLKVEDQYQGQTDRNIDSEKVQFKQEEIQFDGATKQNEHQLEESLTKINTNNNLWWGYYQQSQHYPQQQSFIDYWHCSQYYYSQQYPYSIFRN